MEPRLTLRLQRRFYFPGWHVWQWQNFSGRHFEQRRNYSAQTNISARFAVRFDYTSGDSDRRSNDLETFDPLFPNPMYSSLSALLGPSNLIDVGPTIRLNLDANTAISPEMPFYWRSSIHNGIYNYAGTLIRPGNFSTARFVGYQPGLVLERVFSRHFSTTAGYFYFFAGEFLHQTPPDKNVGYFYATITSRW